MLTRKSSHAEKVSMKENKPEANANVSPFFLLYYFIQVQSDDPKESKMLKNTAEPGVMGPLC